MRNRSDERYKAVHLACRLREKKKFQLDHFYLRQVLSFSFVIHYVFFSISSTVSSQYDLFYKKAHEFLGKRPSSIMIDFGNLILRSFNPH
jgi:hypothetical protein